MDNVHGCDRRRKMYRLRSMYTGLPGADPGMVGAKAEVTGDAAECMGCQSCVMTCPAEAITVTEY